jgi:hypothetical protein
MLTGPCTHMFDASLETGGYDVHHVASEPSRQHAVKLYDRAVLQLCLSFIISHINAPSATRDWVEESIGSVVKALWTQEEKTSPQQHTVVQFTVNDYNQAKAHPVHPIL